MPAVLAGLALVLVSPVLSLFGALARGALLFWPTMILLGALHSFVPEVPALGATPTFFLVALLGLLIPTSTGTNATTK